MNEIYDYADKTAKAKDIRFDVAEFNPLMPGTTFNDGKILKTHFYSHKGTNIPNL